MHFENPGTLIFRALNKKDFSDAKFVISELKDFKPEMFEYCRHECCSNVLIIIKKLGM